MSARRLVLRHATLLDGASPPCPDRTLVVEGEHVTAIGPTDAIAVRPDDDVRELDGRTVMPGMVQSHFHAHFGAFGDGVTAPALGLEAAPAYLSMLAAANAETALRAGFTGAIGSSNAWAIDVSLKEAIQAGFVRGPRYVAGSREVVATGEASDYANNRNFFMELGQTGLTLAVDGADAWRHAARVECGRGCEVIKVSAGPGHGSSPARDAMYPTREELRALVDTAHALGRRVRAHAPSRTAILECARAGVDIIDHADRIDDECIEAILDADATVVPSMLWSERFLALAESWDHDERPLPISEGFPETPAQVRARIAQVREDFEYTCEAMPRAARAGVRMVVGDDYGTPLLPHGDYVPELLLYEKRLGIAPLEVLRWATLNGAGLLGRDDLRGPLAPGRLADLLVVEGDPSQDLAVLSDPARLPGILLGGEWAVDDLPTHGAA